MPTNPTDLNALRLFVAVVDAGGFHAAARRLGVARSTVSHRISGLEDHLGVRLLERTTRQVSVTDAGRAYYDQVRAGLALVDEAERSIAGLGDTPRGRVRLSVSHGVGATWMSAIASRLLARYPDVQLLVGISDRYVDLVADGFDVAIRAGDLGDSSLTARALPGARLACYASPTYLAAHAPIHHPTDLAGHDTILFAPGLSAEWALERADAPEQVTVEVRGRYAVNNHRLHAEAAELGLGVARVFPFMAGSAVTAGRLVRVLPNWDSRAPSLHVVTPGAQHRTAAVRVLLEVIDEVFAGGAPPERA